MVTIKNIAHYAGVSIGTVDRVIHNRGNVSKKTESKIRKTIDELNYKPNIFARNLKLSKDYTFGVLMPQLTQDSNYWRFPANGIKKAEEELKKHRVNVIFFHYDRYSHLSFSESCLQILNSNLDGLLIAPVLSAVAQEFVERIPPSLPYVFFDSFVPNSQCLSNINQNSYLGGRLSAKLMHMIVKEPGVIAAVRVLPEDYHINERIEGFISFFSENTGNTVVVYDAVREKNEAVFHKLTERIIAENKNIKGIFVSNALTYCVAQYVEEVSLNKKIHIIGYDLIDENIVYLKKGIIDFLISQQPETQGYKGIYTLYQNVVLNEEVPDKIMMPLDIITNENIDYYKR